MRKEDTVPWHGSVSPTPRWTRRSRLTGDGMGTQNEMAMAREDPAGPAMGVAACSRPRTGQIDIHDLSHYYCWGRPPHYFGRTNGFMVKRSGTSRRHSCLLYGDEDGVLDL